jgi:Fe-S-cluster containining protein
MNMEKYCKKVRLLAGNYSYLDKLYPRTLLDSFFAGVKVCSDDYRLMDNVYRKLTPHVKHVRDGMVREVIFICVMGNDDADAEFIRNNPQGCQRCGWCCRNCDPIIVRQDEVAKLGSTEHLTPLLRQGAEDAYAIKLPCRYQLPDNGCGIYRTRPDSCKDFPLGLRQGRLTVQRTVHCGFIEFFLVNKAAFFINKLCAGMNGRL